MICTVEPLADSLLLSSEKMTRLETTDELTPPFTNRYHPKCKAFLEIHYY